MKQSTTLGIGIATYSILLLLSVIYFKERTIILDTAFYLFHILQDNSFTISDRFGSVFTQIFPFMGAKLGASLTAITMVYSNSFIIFYTAAFLITWFGLKNYKIAIVILLYNTLITMHSFFWVNSEGIQGIVFALVYLAYVENQINAERVSKRFYWLSILAIPTIVYFYPLMPFTYFFGLFFLLIQYPQKGRKLIWGAAAGFIVIYLVKVLFFRSSYDNTAMGRLDNFIKLFPNYFSTKSNREFWTWMIRDYTIVLISLVAVIVFYLRKKAYLKLSYFAACFFGFMLLINVTNAGGADQFYLEPQYSILTVFLAFPLVYDLFPTISYRSKNVILTVVVLCCFYRIFAIGGYYQNRLDWYRTTMQTSHAKLILQESEIPMGLIKMAWASSFEFWLLSTIEQNSTRSIIVENVPEEFNWANGSPKVFISKWGPFEYDSLNPKYFVFSDTSSLYIRK
ncbi:MAG: hypothetical protein ABIV51_00905 [Saprospiraceae bacterium]